MDMDAYAAQAISNENIMVRLYVACRSSELYKGRWTDEDLADFSSPLLMPDMFEHSSSPMLDWEWSMKRYETALSTMAGQNDAAREAWDELEKSVVKNVADDVKVSIRNGVVEMVILKKLA